MNINRLINLKTQIIKRITELQIAFEMKYKYKKVPLT